jgi:hypothetical protein
MASMKLEEQLEEQVYLTHKYACVKLMIKLHSHRGKSRELIMAKKGKMPQTPMSLNCQNQRKESKVCDWNYEKICWGHLNVKCIAIKHS